MRKRPACKLLALVLVLATLGTLIPAISTDAKALSYSASASYKSGKYYTNLINVQLTGDPRTDIVNVAKSQVGYKEGNNSSQLSGTVRGTGNYTEYGRWYGMQDQWCAIFVSWCAAVAGIGTDVIIKHAFTPTGLNWFKKNGKVYSRVTVEYEGYTPQAGDIVYFKSSSTTYETNHIGIVTGYSNGTLYTIEGNTSSTAENTNGDTVAAKSYAITNTYIAYICKPNYSTTSSDGSSGTVPAGDQISNGTYTIKTYYNSNFGATHQSTSAGMTLQSADSTTRQQYVFKGDGKGYYTIQNVSSGLYLTANGTANGTAITQTGSASGDAQKWALKSLGSGYYYIINKSNGLYLDLSSSKVEAGNSIQCYKGNETNAQKWLLTSVTDSGDSSGGSSSNGSSSGGSHTHNYVLTGQVTANCSREGYTGDTVCSGCGYVKQKGEAVSKTDCEFERIVIIEADCTTDGLVLYLCKGCNTGTKEVLPATGHQYTAYDRESCNCCGTVVKK